MVTIKLAILKSKPAKDGSCKIRIAIGHRQQTHHITTRYSVPSPNNFRDGIIVGTPDAHHLNVKLRNLLNEYTARLDAIIDPNQYTCKQLKDLLKQMRPTYQTTPATFKQVTEEYINQLHQDHRDSYAKMLAFNLSRFLDFANGDMFLSQFSPITVTDYARWMKNRGLSQTTVSMHLSMCRTIINRAIRQQLVRYDINPFAYWHRPADEERELDITTDELKRLRDYNTDKRKYIVARDIFMLSYYLGGINMIDLLNIDFRNVTILEYIRHKSRNTKQTDRRISFTLQPEARVIINRYISRNGKLDFGYKFGYKNFICYVNRTLKQLAEELHITLGNRLCYYSARKSFVQHGFDLGISLEVLEYCIGQSVKNNRPIFNYLKIMRRHADIAMRKIFDNLRT